jgi:hypothetical protein
LSSISMSVIVRRRDGRGCEQLEVDEREASLPADKRAPVPRPADVTLYEQALAQGWPIGPDVRADVVSRLHAVVKYINDPRAVIKASKVLVDASQVSLQAVDTAMKVYAVHSPISSWSPVRKIDLAGRDEQLKPPDPTELRARATDAATEAWDAAKALGHTEHDCDMASLGAWTSVWEEAGYSAPHPPWMEALPDARDP